MQSNKTLGNTGFQRSDSHKITSHVTPPQPAATFLTNQFYFLTDTSVPCLHTGCFLSTSVLSCSERKDVSCRYSVPLRYIPLGFQLFDNQLGNIKVPAILLRIPGDLQTTGKCCTTQRAATRRTTRLNTPLCILPLITEFPPP